MSKSKKRRTAQNPKPRNEAFATAMREKKNLTRPSGNVYKRDRAGARGRDW